MFIGSRDSPMWKRGWRSRSTRVTLQALARQQRRDGGACGAAAHDQDVGIHVVVCPRLQVRGITSRPRGTIRVAGRQRRAQYTVGDSICASRRSAQRFVSSSSHARHAVARRARARRADHHRRESRRRLRRGCRPRGAAVRCRPRASIPSTPSSSRWRSPSATASSCAPTTKRTGASSPRSARCRTTSRKIALPDPRCPRRAHGSLHVSYRCCSFRLPSCSWAAAAAGRPGADRRAGRPVGEGCLEGHPRRHRRARLGGREGRQGPDRCGAEHAHARGAASPSCTTRSR